MKMQRRDMVFSICSCFFHLQWIHRQCSSDHWLKSFCETKINVFGQSVVHILEMLQLIRIPQVSCILLSSILCAPDVSVIHQTQPVDTVQHCPLLAEN